MDAVLRRLDVAEAEIRDLHDRRGLDLASGAEAGLQDAAQDAGVVQAGYCERCGEARSTCRCDQTHVYSDRKQSNHHWLPPLCSSCLEGLSWNKAGGWRLVPFGQLRGEAIFSTATQTADAVIFFLDPATPGVGGDQFTLHGKTSMLNFALTGPDVGTFQTGGLILMNFTGPQPIRNNSGPNLLNAYGELKNDRWRFAFGRMWDLFSPVNPHVVNQGLHWGAGNLGVYRGAIHVDRFIAPHHNQQWTLSARISQQTVNDYLADPVVRGTDNGWPNAEMRVGLALGCPDEGVRPFGLGVSGLIGETRAVDPGSIVIGPANELIVTHPRDVVSDMWGINMDARFAGERFGVHGEVWAGQGAGTYFMAALQSLNPQTGQAIRSVGGWAEASCKVSSRVTLNLGYGIDDPRNGDVGYFTTAADTNRPNDPGQRTLNRVAWGNAIWNVTEFFELAFEISRRRTDYLAPGADNDATLYHFASTLKF